MLLAADRLLKNANSGGLQDHYQRSVSDSIKATATITQNNNHVVFSPLFLSVKCTMRFGRFAFLSHFCALALTIYVCWLSVAHGFSANRPLGRPRKQTMLHLNLGGLFRGSKSGNTNASGADDRGDLTGVSSTIEAIENVESNQKVSRLLSSLLQDLQSSTVEGSSQDGKVKITFDCQQKPVRVTIDENFHNEVDASTMGAAVTEALIDGHKKSTEKMNDKMKGLNSELGI